MPNKTSIVDKRKWLEQYEKGTSEASIASKNKHDVRTIRKGINDARREQDSRFARAGLLKEALQKHQFGMEEELRNIVSSFNDIPSDYTPLSWHKGDQSVFNATLPEQQKRIITKSNKDRNITVLDLLRQHLKNDKVWKLLAQREKDYNSHLFDRMELQKKIVALLEKNTALRVLDRNDVGQFVYSYTTGDLLFKKAIDSYPRTKLEKDITIDTNSGIVKHYGSILAEARGAEVLCRSGILATYKELLTSVEWFRVNNTYPILKESTAKTRQAIEEILMLGLITGQCAICKRLGM